MTDLITVTRSEIETRLKCSRERFLSSNYQNGGLSKRGSKYEAQFGTVLHNCMSAILKMAQLNLFTWPYSCGDEMIEVRLAIDSCFPDQDNQHLKTEQTYLLYTLVNGWAKYRLPSILSNFTILEVEKETHTVFTPENYLPSGLAAMMRPVKLPLRLDCLLRRKGDDLLFIMDFKTCTQASEDWSKQLENSLQSHLYITATEQLMGEPVGGIFYEGLVKGRRELDKAKSSPYQGQVIQYGSFLYGWQAKDGKVYKDYVSGRKRVFLGLEGAIPDPPFLDRISECGFDLKTYLPSTVPWKPLNSGMVVGQMIVNENNFAGNLEIWGELNDGDPVKDYYEQTLFEQNLGSCYKYGGKHPCQFVEICHHHINKWEMAEMYEKRVPHHTVDEVNDND